MTGSGLFDQLGIATESTYGTIVTPTTFMHVKSFDLQPVYEVVQAESFRAGRLAAPSAQRVVTTKAATGTIETEVMTQNWGKIFAAIAGSSTSAQQAATAAYLQTHTFVSSIVGKSLTVQGSRSPRPTGSAVPITMAGAKVTGLDLSCDVNSILQATVSLDGRSVDRSTALAAATYPTAAAPFHGGQMCVKIGTYDAEEALSGVTSVKVNIKRNLDIATFYADCAGLGLKAEPVSNDWPLEISGTLTRDYLDRTAIEDPAWANTPKALRIDWTGANIATSYDYRVTLRLPVVHFEPAAQAVSGRGVNTRDWDFVYRHDGTNAPSISYMTIDTAI